MRVLVTGANGQVGGELTRLAWGPDFEVTAVDRRALELTDSERIKATLLQVAPDVVVNCAAYTAVDAAEDEPEVAFAVNDSAVHNLARAVEDLGSCLIHLSTDYVFDGEASDWYTEEDQTNPQGAYGRSKLAGEAHVLRLEHGIVLRTAWVYSALGANFVKTMRRLAADREELTVVSDQIGCPTAAADIASAVVEIIASGYSETGLFHIAAPDEASWYDFAVEIVGLTSRSELVSVLPITTSEYPTKAKRPRNSRLDCTKLDSSYGITLPSWRDSLRSVSAELDRSRKPVS